MENLIDTGRPRPTAPAVASRPHAIWLGARSRARGSATSATRDVEYRKSLVSRCRRPAIVFDPAIPSHMVNIPDVRRPTGSRNPPSHRFSAHVPRLGRDMSRTAVASSRASRRGPSLIIEPREPRLFGLLWDFNGLQAGKFPCLGFDGGGPRP